MVQKPNFHFVNFFGPPKIKSKKKPSTPPCLAKNTSKNKIGPEPNFQNDKNWPRTQHPDIYIYIYLHSLLLMLLATPCKSFFHIVIGKNKTLTVHQKNIAAAISSHGLQDLTMPGGCYVTPQACFIFPALINPSTSASGSTSAT